jgi:DNA-directed RNA polymerase specialized sigma24 family protein
MEDSRRAGERLSLRAAACTLAGEARQPPGGRRVRAAVDAQLRRAGVQAQDADDVRTEVALALLCAPASELALPVELVCARAAAIARNKSIDLGRRQARSALAFADVPEPPDPGSRPGSLADGLDEVTAAAHTRRVRDELAAALGRLGASERAAIAACAEGGAARAAGLPRSTYYRMLAHAQARLGGDLRGRLGGIGALGGIFQRAREIFQHVEAVHAAAAAATAAVAVAAVALSIHDQRAHPVPAPAAVIASAAAGGRVTATVAPALRAAVATSRPVTLAPAPRAAPAPGTGSATFAPPAAATPSTCTYDPSSYDC